MKRIILLTIAVVTTMVFSSCGSEPKKQEPIEKMIPAANVEIIGDDADAISLAGDVKLFMVKSTSYEEWTMKALVPLKNNETIDVQGVNYVNLDVKDANYSLIHDHFGMVAQDKSVILAMLKSNEGTTKNISFRPSWENISYYEYKKVVDFINRAENITIKIKIDDSYYSSNKSSSSSSSYASSSSSSSSSKKSSGSTSWDKLLDDYEAFVDKYIELYKKAMKGDNSAMTTYVEYMEKITTLAEQLDAAEDDMTTAQLTRYMKITNKMSEAAIELAGETSTYGAGW